MACVYISHPACAEHATGPGHPERPARTQAIRERLAAQGLLDWLDVRTADPATLDTVCRTHKRHHVSNIARAIPMRGLARLDPDTIVGPHSLEAALAAVGAGLQAVDSVYAGNGGGRAFCNIRPPGHHAEPDRSMGFCLFNNIALAAYRALDVHGAARVAILDFDVHHGNGTEAIVRGDRRILYASTFQYPLFPFPELDGEPGHIVKTPLPAGAGGDTFRDAVERDWLPALRSFDPQLVLFSAGFDAHRADPLADLTLTETDFAWVTQAVLAELAGGVPVVSLLEGGYDLDALAHSAEAHVRALADL